MLELAEYLTKVGQVINMKHNVVWLLVWNGICQCKIRRSKLAKAVPVQK